MFKTIGKPLPALAAVAVFCAAVVHGSAQETQQKQKQGKKGGKGPDVIGKMLEAVDLTADQKIKVDEIRKEHQPALAALQKRRSVIMTRDRRMAEKEAKQAAKDDGKKGKEAKAAVEAALGLSLDERERLAVIQKEQQALRAKIESQLRAILKDEQKARLAQQKAKKKKKQKE